MTDYYDPDGAKGTQRCGHEARIAELEAENAALKAAIHVAPHAPLAAIRRAQNALRALHENAGAWMASEQRMVIAPILAALDTTFGE